MQAVILAAGAGSRMGKLTSKTPKPLLLVDQKPIIEHVLESLPPQIKKAIIIVRPEDLQVFSKQLGSSITISRRKLSLVYCIQDPQFTGTYGGLHATKKHLLDSNFLVLNGDDIIDSKSLSLMLQNDLSLGLCHQKVPSSKYFVFDVSPTNKILKMRRPTEEELSLDQLVATGIYFLTPQIWSLEPAHLKDEEYGLPQTLAPILQDFHAVIFNSWQSINTPEDLQKARAQSKKH